MKKVNPLTILTRTDKWYLGGGNRLLWAPTFPLFLDYPGFWDRAHYYNFKLQPLYTWTILNEHEMEIPLQYTFREWHPACLTQTYKMVNGKWKKEHEVLDLDIIERKTILEDDVAVCQVQLINKSKQEVKLHFLIWTVQESLPSKQAHWLTGVAFHDGIIEFTKHLKNNDRPPFCIGAAFGLNQNVHSYSINLSEGSALLPQWQLTPFYEKFSQGRLPNEIKLSGVNNDGRIYMALHTEIILQAESEKSIVLGLAAASTVNEAKQNLSHAMNMDNPIQLSVKQWNDYFTQVPYFECSDEYFTRYYWYRCYGLRLNTIKAQGGNYKYPLVCEGIDYFRAPISYSAMAHIQETRWMHEPELARGCFLTFMDHQREDGSFYGYIDVYHLKPHFFYHANWGRALLALEKIHSSKEFLQTAYEGLKRYAEYFDRERDREGSGLYDILNHYETGQEYVHRYLAVDSEADKKNWGAVFCLKGVDVTVYIYELKQALAKMAEKLGKRDEAVQWHQGAEKIKKAILERMWDSEEEMFFDVDPKTGERTQVKAATCFYPYFTDIVDQEQVAGFKKHLLNPKEFWTPYPVPSSSAKDAYFSAEPEWKGKRMNCPWNGRVWPMTNSHIAEALATTAIRFNDSELKEKTVEFITKFIRMMFFDGDPKRPNCFEHYNPMTGKPSLYRGIDDYQHSWVVDLMIKYVCGIRPEEDSVVIEPFPFNIESFLLDNVFIRGSKLKIARQDKNFSVWLNNKFVDEGIVGQTIKIYL